MAVRRSERKNMGSTSVENLYRMALTFPEVLIANRTSGFVPKMSHLGQNRKADHKTDFGGG
jgi:hypothetical protein